MIQRRVTQPTEVPPSGAVLDALYSAITVDHIAHPRNLGVLDDASGVGIVDDAETENYLVFYVRLTNARVESARFRALACSACIAASSILTELVAGMTFDRALHLDESDVLTALGGLPETKRHCAALAAQAAHLALTQARVALPD